MYVVVLPSLLLRYICDERSHSSSSQLGSAPKSITEKLTSTFFYCTKPQFIVYRPTAAAFSCSINYTAVPIAVKRIVHCCIYIFTFASVGDAAAVSEINFALLCDTGTSGWATSISCLASAGALCYLTLYYSCLLYPPTGIITHIYMYTHALGSFVRSFVQSFRPSCAQTSQYRANQEVLSSAGVSLACAFHIRSIYTYIPRIYSSYTLFFSSAACTPPHTQAQTHRERDTRALRLAPFHWPAG